MKTVLTIDQYKDLVKKSRPKAKCGWRTIGGRRIYFRSSWEANYGRYLQFLKEKQQIYHWEHEPKTFWFEKIKRGCRSYLPDFKVFDFLGNHHWVEVKGYMDPRSATKLKRFAKYYPKEKITLIEKPWFMQNKDILKKLIQGWE